MGPNNPAFSSLLPGLQIYWDSTSLGEFKTCPRKYYYTLVHGVAPRAESVHLTFGILYHKALEIYDYAKTEGKGHLDALDESVKYCLEATWDRAKNRPWNSDNENKNRYTLVRTVVWYLDQFEEDSIKTVHLANGKPAVELHFQFETNFMSFSTGEPFSLCGHMDRIGTFGDETYIVDRKTTASTITQDFFNRFTPDNQFSAYTLAGKVAFGIPVKGLIVDAAQIAVTFSRFERGIVERHPQQIDEWFHDFGLWLKQAEFYAKENYWPQNDKSCSMYGGCPFRPICSKAPSVREEWIEAGFHPRVWNPLQIRGDI